MITPCTKEKTKSLEYKTVPVEVILYRANNFAEMLSSRDTLPGYIDKYHKLLNWCHKNGFDTSTPQHVQNSKLIELIGFNPQYHSVRGSDHYMNAIWGFDYEGDGCVMYHSRRGLSLQVAPEMEKGSAVELIDLLIEKLNCDKD
jgi:hypothetical protein